MKLILRADVENLGSLGDVVNVKILSVDPKKNRISLTMRF